MSDEFTQWFMKDGFRTFVGSGVTLETLEGGVLQQGFYHGVKWERDLWYEQMKRNADLAKKCAEAKRLIQEGKIQRFEDYMSEKPIVTWRCLKTDPPDVYEKCWVSAPGCSEPVIAWTTETIKPDKWIGLGYTVWAPYMPPEPPQKPEPFEVWMMSFITSCPTKVDTRQREDMKLGHCRFMSLEGKQADLKHIFDAGYEAGKATK